MKNLYKNIFSLYLDFGLLLIQVANFHEFHICNFHDYRWRDEARFFETPYSS